MKFLNEPTEIIFIYIQKKNIREYSITICVKNRKFKIKSPSLTKSKINPINQVTYICGYANDGVDFGEKFFFQRNHNTLEMFRSLSFDIVSNLNDEKCTLFIKC